MAQYEIGGDQLNGIKEYLTPLGWPSGMQKMIASSIQTCPLRFFLIDDSGSMCAGDGKQVAGSGARKK
jgi:hypothetical protein